MNNPNIAAVANFKLSLNLLESSISQRFSQVDTQSKSKSLTDFLSLEARKTLSELKETQENGIYTTLVTITKIETRFNWYFDACSIHGNKVNIQGGLLTCKKCELTPRLIVQRYKIHVEVKDAYENVASFVLFDNIAFQLIHQTTNDLKNRLLKEGDEDGFPEELDCLLKRKFLFKVEVSDFTKADPSLSFTVKKLTEDPELINYFASSLPQNHVAITPDLLTNFSEGGSLTTNDIETVSIIDGDSVRAYFRANNSTCVNENDISSSNTFTPLKISHLSFDKEADLDDSLSPQFSTTKLIPRIKKKRLD